MSSNDNKNPMLESLSIRNFRGFSKLSIPHLERVNLITGMNNAGKTSVLEALFIQAIPNNPELLLRTNVFRGFEKFDADSEEIWGSFFFERDVNKTIDITSEYSNGKSQTLKIRLVDSSRSQISTRSNINTNRDITTTSLRKDQLLFDYKDLTGNKSTSNAIINNNSEIVYNRGSLRYQRESVFLTSKLRFPLDDSRRFSKLERIGRENEVLDIMRVIEPRLKRLSVLVSGGLPIIHGDIGLESLIPVPSMGEGMARLLSIVLAILQFPNGIVLIDEIENGFHHSVLCDVWNAIAVLARKENVQVFCTTHSWECIQAAHKTFSSFDYYDLKLYRLERINNDVEAVEYTDETLNTSIEFNMEMR